MIPESFSAGEERVRIKELNRQFSIQCVEPVQKTLKARPKEFGHYLEFWKLWELFEDR